MVLFIHSPCTLTGVHFFSFSTDVINVNAFDLVCLTQRLRLDQNVA